jgi:CheY-like chemotaxis protein
MSGATSSGRDAILIIDDNRINMELVTVVLRAEGYAILQAADAETGIALARDEQPALILMDLSLPGMDGLAATGLLQGEEATKQIPIVALTGHATPEDEVKALAAGCAGYIAKPIDTRTFPELIQQFIRMSRRIT